MCCVVTAFTFYRILNRTCRSAALTMGAGDCRQPFGALVHTLNNYLRLIIEPEIICQILSAVLSRTTNTLTCQTTTSSSLTIAFDQLNDAGSDTVFHALNTVSKSLHDETIHTKTVGPRSSDLDPIMHGVSELAQCAPLSGYVENMQPPPCWP